MRNISNILLLFLLLLPSVSWGQGKPVGHAAGPKMEQPTAAGLGLKSSVRKVVSLTQYEGGNDMTLEEEWDFAADGKLTRYVKRGFGGEHVTAYPRPQEDSKLQKTTRDDDGDPLEVRSYAQDGRLLSSAHYVYAEGGALAAIVTYAYGTDDENVVSSHTEAYYDKHGHLSSVEQYTADAELQMTERYKYNRHGDLVKRTQTFFDGAEKEVATEQRKYTYDSRGNWTRCTYLNNGKSYYAVCRTFDYYAQ